MYKKDANSHKPWLEIRRKIGNLQINFISLASMSFYLLSQLEIRLRLGKLQINLRFLSPCTNFVI